MYETKTGHFEMSDAEFTRIWTLACFLIQQKDEQFNRETMRAALRDAFGFHESVLQNLLRNPIGIEDADGRGGTLRNENGRIVVRFDQRR
jgi:hypothetical protein